MKYQVKDSNSDKVLFESYAYSDCSEFIEYQELKGGEYYINEFIPCKGCDGEGYEQSDAHGISTGYWCDSCYESDRYPYRKDRYPTMEYDGYGERLDDDY